MGNVEALGGSRDARGIVRQAPGDSAPAPGKRVVARDLRSIRLEQVLRDKWRLEIKGQSPADREKWLKSQEGIVALGARQCSQLLTALGKRANRVRRQVFSNAWLKRPGGLSSSDHAFA